MTDASATGALRRFSAATQAWFDGAFAAPTAAQAGAWESIATGRHTLVIAPTGSGKTLASFLWAIDRMLREPAAPEPEPAPAGASDPPGRSPGHSAERGTRVLYISPLKALGVDVERNLRAPLVGIAQTAKRLGIEVPEVSVGVRSGDTPTGERRALLRHPPEILITTPESLYLMLTSGARETLSGVETVIIDEVHAVAATKRGAHLALSLERLDALLPKPAQRIGLSATVRPREEVARFLGGAAPVGIVAPESGKRFELRVVVPVEDMGDLQAAPSTGAEGEKQGGTIWPHVDEAVLDEVLAHRSTIVFANSRRLAERLTAHLNELYAARLGFDEPEPSAQPPAAMIGQSGQTGGFAPEAPLLARAHHGSVSKEQRAIIEDDLKTGRLRCVVATSSLELGIDMGEVDLVVQVGAPPSVASGLQRIGRAGHQVGEVSTGTVFPAHRADLVLSAVAVERMLGGLIEELRVPQNPLDILAQQTVAAVSVAPVDADDWFDLVRRSAPFASLPRSAYEATLDLLAGKYPSEQFGELRPRLVWDRDGGVLTARPGAGRLAITSGGTIPDRGLFGVFMVGEPGTAGRRVGELDEEMVYESRVGDVFALGATSWRIQEITFDRVIVTPAFGEPGRVPFWHGDALGRPAELGEAVGRFTRELSNASAADASARLAAAGLEPRAAANLLRYFEEQKQATRHIPTDRTLVVERFHDELGDWRVVLHSPYGMQVHAPWALAVGARVRERLGIDGAALASDDGIVVRIPDSDAEPPGAELFEFDADELEQTATVEVGGSALFAARFREASARALLFPRYDPGRRTPLWQQRMRSAQLLEVARQYPQFPIVLETMRECLQDVYDLPALGRLARDIAARRVRIVETTTEQPSPYARTLLFGYIAAFMYEGDNPLAERRAAALSVDPALLAELLGKAELRELLDPAVVARIEAELQRLAPGRRARDAEGVADLLRVLGPLSVAEIEARFDVGGRADLAPDAESSQLHGSGATEPDIHDDSTAAVAAEAVATALSALADARRILRVTIAGVERWAAIEDAPRLRDGLGIPLPIGVPFAFLEPVDDPLGDLLGRYARTHGPFGALDAASRFGLGTAVVLDTLRRLAQQGRVVEGEFRPIEPAATKASRVASTTDWCDAQVLRRLRRLSLAALRSEIAPVEPRAFARFLPAWQNVGTGQLRGVDGVAAVVEQLAGSRIPASAWESFVLPSRVADYSPAMLDELTASGEVLWAGAGMIPGRDGWLTLHLAETAALTLPPPHDHETDELQRQVLLTLTAGGGFFFRQLAEAVGPSLPTPLADDALETALWELVWAGLVSNDTLAPIRALTGTRAAHRRQAPPPRARLGRGSLSRSALRAAYIAGGGGSTAGRAGAPTVAGRWSLVPGASTEPTLRARAEAAALLDRYGVVTRGSVVAEGTPGGFALAYRVLSRIEENGQVRRGYFIDGLGAAQFASSATVDRVRSFAPDADAARPALDAITLAATDPANAYGAALPWPANPSGEGHRPGRKAGALVVLVDGALVLYLERGGKTVLAFDDAAATLDAAAASLAAAVRRGGIDRLAIELVNGAFVLGTRLGEALATAGFTETPRGLRLRS